MGEEMPQILIVDDEQVIRGLLTDALKETGYSLLSAESGKAALDLMRDNRVDLLLTDIMMPEMDGLELVRNVRESFPEVIPMVMTGYATLDTARAAFKEGAYDYVLKPFNITEVRVAIANAFERKRLRDENARLREITDLLTISNSINTIRSEEELLDLVLDFALTKVRASRGSVMVLEDEAAKHLKIAASKGIPDDIVHICKSNTFFTCLIFCMVCKTSSKSISSGVASRRILIVCTNNLRLPIKIMIPIMKLTIMSIRVQPVVIIINPATIAPADPRVSATI